MMKIDPLDEIVALKQRAVALRNRDKLELALAVLDEAEERLEQLLADPLIDPGRRAALTTELADTHGMKGGVNRRRRRLEEALDEYDAGARMEGSEATTTYNLGNSIVLSLVLGRQRLDDPLLQERTASIVQRLEKQTAGARSDEWWAFADLAQFRLLQGDVSGARQAYVKGRATGPSAAELQRPLDVLAEIAGALQSSHPQRHDEIHAFIDWARIQA